MDPNAKVAFGVYWDCENAAVPRGADIDTIFMRLRAEVEAANGMILRFLAYNPLERHRSKMQDLGMEVINASRKARKEAADHRMLVDMFRFALDRGVARRLTFVVVSGDSDFAYACATLRNYGHHIWLFHPPTCGKALRTHAHVFRSWRAFCLGGRHVPSMADYAHSVASPSPSASASASASPPAVSTRSGVSIAIPAIEGAAALPATTAAAVDADVDDDDEDDGSDMASDISETTCISNIRDTLAVEYLMEVFEEHVEDNGTVLKSRLGIQLQNKYPGLVQARGDAAALIRKAMDLGMLVKVGDPHRIGRAPEHDDPPVTPLSLRSDAADASEPAWPSSEEELKNDRLAHLLAVFYDAWTETGEVWAYQATLGSKLCSQYPELFVKGALRPTVAHAKQIGYVIPFQRDGRTGHGLMLTPVGLQAAGRMHARLFEA